VRGGILVRQEETMTRTSAPGEAVSVDPVRRARRGLAVYLGLVIPLAAVFEVLLLRPGASIRVQPLLVFGLMWTPAVSSVIARLALREGFADVSFRLGRRRRWGYLVAWLFPLAVGALAYGVAWATGLADFALPAARRLEAGHGVPAAFALRLGMQLTLGVAVSCLSAAGEEIGWRGYMLTRLIDARVPRPVLVGGVLWAAWHAPLIVGGAYASNGNAALSLSLFTVDVVAFSYLISRLRLETGSVWPAVLLHASWNAVIQGVFDSWTARASIWVGEEGILVAASDLLLVLLLVRGRWAMRREPKDPAPAERRGLGEL
jgi:uncharacterized protein